jgi:predicted Zn-dependent protease
MHKTIREKVRASGGQHLVTLHLLILVALLGLLTTAPGFGKKRKSPILQGNDLYDRGRYAEAVEAYSRALEEDPNDPKACFNRALANEMVNRANAIADWKHFLQLAGTDAQWSDQVKLVKPRLLALELLPPVPDLLSPSRYLAKDDDYYRDVATQSTGTLWARFPVRVFVSTPPQNWKEPVQKALDAWGRVFPIQVVDTEDKADLVLKWGSVNNPLEPTGMTEDTQEDTLRGDTVATSRRRAVVTLDTAHRLSGDEMLSAALHQIGHGLGIRGHSGRMSDAMYLQGQHVYSELQGGESLAHRNVHAASGVSDQSITNTQITQRDINTLVRLYNSPSPLLPLD